MAEILGADQIDGDDKTSQKRQRTQHAEEMHRTVAELRDEVDGNQVEIATNETAQAELAFAELALLMVHNLLPDVAKAIHLGNDWNVTVHLAIHLDILHHFIAISLKTAVEVVQLDA